MSELTCMIGRRDNSGYCGKPATVRWGKLPACDDCAADLNRQIEEHRTASNVSGA